MEYLILLLSVYFALVNVSFGLEPSLDLFEQIKGHSGNIVGQANAGGIERRQDGLVGTKHLGPRRFVAVDRYLDLNTSVGINARIPDKQSSDLKVRGGALARRALLEFDTSQLAEVWRQVHTVDDAYLELTLGEVECEALYLVDKIVSSADSIADATWNCPADEDLRPANPAQNCDSTWNGGALVGLSGFRYIESDDANSVVEIPIKSIGESRPDKLVVKRASELDDQDDQDDQGGRCRNSGGGSSKNECSQCSIEILDARVRLHTKALAIRDSEVPFEGMQDISKTFEGVEINVWKCESRRNTPAGAPKITTVRVLGVPFSIDAFREQAEFFCEVGDEIILSQRCQGASECKLTNGVNDPLERGRFYFDFLFDSAGLGLEPGTVALYGQDQGSSLNMLTYGYAISQGKGNHFVALLDFEGWWRNAYCPEDQAIAGLCVNGFYTDAVPGEVFGFLNNVGFDFFGECSQDGLYGDTNSSTSCGALMHLVHNYFYQNSTSQFCSSTGGVGEADVRAQYPSVSALDSGCVPFQFGLNLLYRIDDFGFIGAAEKDFAVRWWQEGAPELLEKRSATGEWFPRNLYRPTPHPQCDGATQSCDVSALNVAERTDSTTVALPDDQVRVAFDLHMSVGEFAKTQTVSGVPGQDFSYFFDAGWPAVSFDPSGQFSFNPIIVDGAYTGVPFCPEFPDSRCKEDGHGAALGFKPAFPANFPISGVGGYYEQRNLAMETSTDLSNVMSPLGAHADPASGSNNARAWARSLANVAGELEEPYL